MPYSLPPIQGLVDLSESSKRKLLDHLFEPCDTLYSLVFNEIISESQNFTSYRDFIETIRDRLLKFLGKSELDAKKNNQPLDPRIYKIIAAHPRLGAPKETTVAIELSEHSAKEQKSLQASSKEEEKQLAELNEKYEITFPGLRYVVFVNGRSRQVIMQNMKERIDRDEILLEIIESFHAMCDIALDRAKKLGAKL